LRISEEKGFNGLIFDCIERALEMLGESVASSVLYQIETKYQFPRVEFAARPLDLVEHLRAFFGPTGFVVIEKLIVKEIMRDFGILSAKSYPSLESVMEQARKAFLAR
jgi:hypothetical protein